jgi:hypothetical protein
MQEDLSEWSSSSFQEVSLNPHSTMVGTVDIISNRDLQRSLTVKTNYLIQTNLFSIRSMTHLISTRRPNHIHLSSFSSRTINLKTYIHYKWSRFRSHNLAKLIRHPSNKLKKMARINNLRSNSLNRCNSSSNLSRWHCQSHSNSNLYMVETVTTSITSQTSRETRWLDLPIPSSSRPNSTLSSNKAEQGLNISDLTLDK